MSVTQDPRIRSYLVAVEAHLDDLSQEERRELLEGVEEHLTEVSLEGEGPLAERIGLPAIYAAELRASAGLRPIDQTAPPARPDVLRTRIAALRTSDWATSARTFLPELRPGWWVLRGYLAVVIFDAFLSVIGLSGPVGAIPSFGGSMLAGLLMVGFAIVASVAFGRRSQGGAMRALAVAGNSLVFIGLVITMMINNRQYEPMPIEYSQTQDMPWLAHEDGASISNICAYDSTLRPLDRVLLYDQDGKPIDNHAEPDNHVVPELGDHGAPGAELKPGFGNAYPRPQKIVDPNTGKTASFACPTFESKAPKKK